MDFNVEEYRQSMEDLAPNQSSIYVATGNEATNLKLVYSKRDMEFSDMDSFKPTMSHQVYGPTEVIFGYRNLSVNMYYLANSAKCFFDLKHSEIVKPEFGLKEDDIYKMLHPWLAPGYYTDKKEFLHQIDIEDHTKMFGKSISNFHAREYDNLVHSYHVTQCDISEPEFKVFHSRFQSFIVWFIDAASFIDLDDPRWMFFYLYEEIHISTVKKIRYPVGFCTVYKFWAYSEKMRPRISQFFILPPFQRKGLGSKLLKAVYDVLQKIEEVTDIVVEDPNPVFTKMRDYLDASLLITLPEFSHESLKRGFLPVLWKVAKQQFKINCRQVRRIYEVLRFAYIRSPNDPEYKTFTDTIIRRLRLPLMKPGLRRLNFRNANIRPRDKAMRNALVDPDFMKAVNEKFREYLLSIQDTVERIRQNLIDAMPIPSI